MTTLADLPPEQRAQCIGMWCNVSTERYKAILVRTYMADDVRYAQMLSPEINDYYTAHLESITPRPDLPRAWTPQGTPTPGDWENGEAIETYDADPWFSCEAIITGESTEQESAIPPDQWDKHVTTTNASKYEREGKSRRFITEWEPAWPKI